MKFMSLSIWYSLEILKHPLLYRLQLESQHFKLGNFYQIVNIMFPHVLWIVNIMYHFIAKFFSHNMSP